MNGYISPLQHVIDDMYSEDISLPPREYMRTTIITSAGRQMLSVPIVGGTSVVKRQPPDEWMISDHGHWTRVHLGALEASYSRTPFFPHFFPGLHRLIVNHPQSAMEFTDNIRQWICECLDFDKNFPAMLELKRMHPELVDSRFNQLLKYVDPEISIVDPLFRFGREMIFLFSQKRLNSIFRYHING